MESFHEADLPLKDGRVYHLGLKPEELAADIIVVGDPDRASLVAGEFFESLEVERFNRGLRTVTGRMKGTRRRVSVVTSGMGTPSLEIVLNEIVALKEIDLLNMRRREECERITVIRVGTSGALRENTDLGTLVISAYAVGLDNTGLFYDSLCPGARCREIEEAVRRVIDSATPADARFRGRIHPYGAMADPDVVTALEEEAKKRGVPWKTGITVTNSGFFANQGREVSRLSPTVPEIDALLADFPFAIDGLRMENMEMEASFLLHFLGGLGHRAGAICPVIDSRREGIFLEDYGRPVRDAIRVALGAFERLA